MKAYKFTFLIFILLASVSFGFAQDAEKTFVKSFNLQGNDVVALNLEGAIDVQTWSNSIMRIQMNVLIENTSETTLKSLVRAGRYNLKSTVEDDVYTVYAPGMERDVRIKGTDLNEKLSFVVYVPEGVTVQQTDGSSAAVDTADAF